jgi:hypothetical protein
MSVSYKDLLLTAVGRRIQRSSGLRQALWEQQDM